MRTVGRIVLSETPMATRINSGGAKICRSVEYRNRTASFGTAGQVDRTCRINTVAVWRERRDHRRQWPRWRRLDRASVRRREARDAVLVPPWLKPKPGLPELNVLSVTVATSAPSVNTLMTLPVIEAVSTSPGWIAVDVGVKFRLV